MQTTFHHFPWPTEVRERGRREEELEAWVWGEGEGGNRKRNRERSWMTPPRGVVCVCVSVCVCVHVCSGQQYTSRVCCKVADWLLGYDEMHGYLSPSRVCGCVAVSVCVNAFVCVSVFLWVCVFSLVRLDAITFLWPQEVYWKNSERGRDKETGFFLKAQACFLQVPLPLPLQRLNINTSGGQGSTGLNFRILILFFCLSPTGQPWPIPGLFSTSVLCLSLLLSHQNNFDGSLCLFTSMSLAHHRVELVTEEVKIHSNVRTDGAKKWLFPVYRVCVCACGYVCEGPLDYLVSLEGK